MFKASLEQLDSGDDPQTVAVKRLQSNGIGDGSQDFIREINIMKVSHYLSATRHPLVSTFLFYFVIDLKVFSRQNVKTGFSFLKWSYILKIRGLDMSVKSNHVTSNLL